MPRRNKQRNVGRSSSSHTNKSSKSNRNALSSDRPGQHESDSDEKCCAGLDDDEKDQLSDGDVESEFASLVADESSAATTMVQVESEALTAAPSGSKRSKEQHKATITLKVIQFIGEGHRGTSDGESLDDGDGIDGVAENEIENFDNAQHCISIIDELTHEQLDVVGNVPKLDRNKAAKETSKHSFDGNYRFESPKKICIDTEPTPHNIKRHTMLIQEISDTSSSEEKKQFLDSEATALKMNVESELTRSYLVESLLSSYNNNSNKTAQTTPMQKLEMKPIFKVINAMEHPKENVNELLIKSPTLKIDIFECKTEKKLNKAEEAILEALYGKRSLLQVSHLPLDVIPEEGSECSSDIDKKKASIVDDEIDDDVFLPPPDMEKKPAWKKNARVEQPLFVINTKIIEPELNIQEGCKTWETNEGDRELQAELVYLTSTSSSANDLSERDDTDSEHAEDTSEGTETNSLLENISVLSLDNLEHDTIEIRCFQQDFFKDTDEQKLADIIEEDEEQAPKSFEIIESQQQIEDVNKELHCLVDKLEGSQARQRLERASQRTTHKQQQHTKDKYDENSQDENALEIISDNACDKMKKVSSEVEQDNGSSDRVTPTPSRRKNSTDSSSSSNSQCTIIKQTPNVNPLSTLRDLCIHSMGKISFDNNKVDNDEGEITFHRKLNSLSQNAAEIPFIGKLELHCECDNDKSGFLEKSRDQVITILQVTPEINSTSTASLSPDRWIGLQSEQIPHLMVALSPLQSSYVMTSQGTNTSADVLLDMHKKFVERRAYHETDETVVENSREATTVMKVNESQLESFDRELEEGAYYDNRGIFLEDMISPEVVLDSRESSCAKAVDCDIFNSSSKKNENDPLAVESVRINSIRNFILRGEFFNSSFAPSCDVDFVESFEMKKIDLENELKRLDSERRELEEELNNLQSMQHFKREEFLYNKKHQYEQENDEQKKFQTPENRHSTAINDFNEFIISNEKLQQELYNEWQDRVLERYERKLQKAIKITSITETKSHGDQSARAASEILRFEPLESEFMTKLRERQKRLSLPTETELNSSTESLHQQNEEIVKNFDKKLNMPLHLHEFLKYYEEELAQSKNPNESGESKITKKSSPFLIGLIGVSMSLCAFFIGKYFITQKPKLF